VRYETGDGATTLSLETICLRCGSPVGRRPAAGHAFTARTEAGRPPDGPAAPTLLPATLIAGILGVNMLPKYLLHPWALWAGIGLMVVIAATVLLTMRLLRRWL
jgi:hypothetical protein